MHKVNIKLFNMKACGTNLRHNNLMKPFLFVIIMFEIIDFSNFLVIFTLPDWKFTSFMLHSHPNIFFS